ncbi:MAG: hydrogenase formation protein HypD [Calditrichaceae bacterium]
MKYIDEFRNPEIAKHILQQIKDTVTQPWVIMEICGGQTHSILKNGLDQLLPKEIELVHGPGCPVCVTPLEMIDQALAIARQLNVIFTSFGDMLRVPGTHDDLFKVKSEGGDVRMVYSPLEALKLARENPDKEVVFFAVGFETTAPGNAMAVHQAAKEGLTNFSELVSHVLVPPAMEALLSSPDNRVQAYLAAGHVCAIMGWNEYIPIAEKYKVPIVPTGFESIDILQGILLTVQQLEEGRYNIENQYTRIVKMEGNLSAQKIINDVFEITFNVGHIESQESPLCISGIILQGLKKTPLCPAYGKQCTPEHPLGATMVSSEGACAAYYRYHK